MIRATPILYSSAAFFYFLYGNVLSFLISPGDHRLYVSGAHSFAYSPENVTIIFYTFLGSYISDLLPVLIIYATIASKFYRKNIFSLVDWRLLLFFLLHPGVVFLANASKEAILLVAFILIYEELKKASRGGAKFKSGVLVAALIATIFLIRNIYVIPILAYFIFSSKFLRKKLLVIFVPLYVAISFFLLLWLADVNIIEKINIVFLEIERSFSGYTANTNRTILFFDHVEHLSYVEIVFLAFIGVATLIFGYVPIVDQFEFQYLPLVLLGFVKISTLAYLWKNRFFVLNSRPIGLVIFVIVFIFVCSLLSIFNIGSSVRYQVPLFFLLMYIYIDIKSRALSYERNHGR